MNKYQDHTQQDITNSQDDQQCGDNSNQKQKNSEYMDESKLKKSKQNDIHFQIIMKYIEINDLQKLKQKIDQYDSISTLQIHFSDDDYNQVGLNQLISVLSGIQILSKLKILLKFSILENIDIIKFAYEISKSSSIQSFTLELIHYNSTVYSFNIRQNNEKGQNVVSQLEYMKNNRKYSTLEDLFQVSQNIYLTKLNLNASSDKLNLKNETNLAKKLSKFYYLEYLKYTIKTNEVQYDQILSLNQVLCSIQNLQKLDLYINFENQQNYYYENEYETNDNLLIEKKLNFEKDQNQMEYQKIKEISKQCKNIECVNLIMKGNHLGLQEQSNYNFQMNLFKIIMWSIQNVQILNIDIAYCFKAQFINEISHFLLVESLTFKTNSSFLIEENSDKLGISLNKCKKLKRLEMHIDLNIIKGEQNNLIISNHLKQLPCQKNIIIQITHCNVLGNTKGVQDEREAKAHIIDQMKEILRLNNIYSLTFKMNFNFQELISLLKNPISKITTLQTISFSEKLFSENKTKKYITWESKKKPKVGGGLIRCGYYDDINEIYSPIKLISENNDFKKGNRLVKISLLEDKDSYF